MLIKSIAARQISQRIKVFKSGRSTPTSNDWFARAGGGNAVGCSKLELNYNPFLNLF